VRIRDTTATDGRRRSRRVRCITTAEVSARRSNVALAQGKEPRFPGNRPISAPSDHAPALVPGPRDAVRTQRSAARWPSLPPRRRPTVGVTCERTAKMGGEFRTSCRSPRRIPLLVIRTVSGAEIRIPLAEIQTITESEPRTGNERRSAAASVPSSSRRQPLRRLPKAAESQLPHGASNTQLVPRQATFALSSNESSLCQAVSAASILGARGRLRGVTGLSVVACCRAREVTSPKSRP